MKTLVVVLGVIWTGINVHFTRAGVVDGLLKSQVEIRDQVNKNTTDIARTNERITNETISRRDFDLYTNQLNLTLSNLNTSVQQIYNALVLQGRIAGPVIAPTITTPLIVAPVTAKPIHR